MKTMGRSPKKHLIQFVVWLQLIWIAWNDCATKNMCALLPKYIWIQTTNYINCFLGDLPIVFTIIPRQCVHNHILDVLRDIWWVYYWFLYLTPLQVVLRNVLFERILWHTNFIWKLSQAAFFAVCNILLFCARNLQQVFTNSRVGTIKLGLIFPNPFWYPCINLASSIWGRLFSGAIVA